MIKNQYTFIARSCNKENLEKLYPFTISVIEKIARRYCFIFGSYLEFITLVKSGAYKPRWHLKDFNVYYIEKSDTKKLFGMLLRKIVYDVRQVDSLPS